MMIHAAAVNDGTGAGADDSGICEEAQAHNLSGAISAIQCDYKEMDRDDRFVTLTEGWGQCFISAIV